MKLLFSLFFFVSPALGGLVEQAALLPTCDLPPLEEATEEITSDGFCDASTTATAAESAYSESSYKLTSPATLESDRAGSDLGEPQVIEGTTAEATAQRIQDARTYMAQSVMVEEKYSRVRHLCKNEHAQCAFWATIGECDANPGTCERPLKATFVVVEVEFAFCSSQ